MDKIKTQSTYAVTHEKETSKYLRILNIFQDGLVSTSLTQSKGKAISQFLTPFVFTTKGREL